MNIEWQPQSFNEKSRQRKVIKAGSLVLVVSIAMLYCPKLGRVKGLLAQTYFTINCGFPRDIQVGRLSDPKSESVLWYRRYSQHMFLFVAARNLNMRRSWPFC